MKTIKGGILCLLALILVLPVIQGLSGAQELPKSKLEINREPILTLQWKSELVEILPGGIRYLGQSSGYSGMRVGAEGRGALSIEGTGRVQISTKLLQLDKNGLTLDVTITESKSGKILTSRTLSLNNYQEAIIELATSESGNSRIAIRLLPTIVVKEAVLDYPVLVREFGTEEGLLILNNKEVLARPSGKSGIDDLQGNTIQFFSIQSSRTGNILISYRPFPGASVFGYFEDRKLVFEWNGDIYEWISLKPILPEGRWAAYVGRIDASTNQDFSVGFAAGNPKDLSFLRRPIR
jgi:hypothetical protein